MNRDGTIRTEFGLELPRTESPALGGALWGTASGVLVGRADPERAIGAFDPTRSQPFEVTAATIDQNVAGWASWATGEVFRRWVSERDVSQLLADPSLCLDELRAVLAPQFEPWAFLVESVDLRFSLAEESLAGLPEPSRRSLAPSPDSGKKLLQHTFSGDIPSVKDPATGRDIQVRCNVRVSFEVDVAAARLAVGASGQISPDRLEREILARCEEWFWYGVKQSFFNWIYDTGKPHRRFVRDYSLIEPMVMGLCGQGLASLGAAVVESTVRYEALNQDSAWALTAPGASGAGPVVAQSDSGGVPGAQATSSQAPGSGASSSSPEAASAPNKLQIRPDSPEHRAGSDQAMAATIAIMNVDDLDLPPSGGPDGGLPSIEEAAWRHQKWVMKNSPGADRARTAEEVLTLLKKDGYPAEERRRIAKVIGADPDLKVD